MDEAIKKSVAADERSAANDDVKQLQTRVRELERMLAKTAGPSGSSASGKNKAAPKAKRPRQDKRRARNREALIEAAIELVITDGPGALTPLRITEHAGLNKNAFHAHFKDATECLQAVALHVHDLNLGRDLRAYHDAFAALPVDLQGVRTAIENALRAAVPYAKLYRLFGRCYYDESPLGQTLRETLKESSAAWTQTLWELAAKHGVHAKHLPEIQTLAELLVEYGLVATTRVIEGREKDVVAQAARMQRYNRAIVTAELRRMLGLPEILGDEELFARQSRPPAQTPRKAPRNTKAAGS